MLINSDIPILPFKIHKKVTNFLYDKIPENFNIGGLENVMGNFRHKYSFLFPEKGLHLPGMLQISLEAICKSPGK